MSSKPDNDDDSFIIILGTSPGGSLDVKCDGVDDEGKPSATPILEDAIKDLPDQANMAFKAQFRLGDSPSPASMMVASTLITDDRSTEELQKRFGELLDENVVLKETLKQNNDSMKEQFSLIASCQEDMLRTHKLHKEKFDETRDLVEKLRLENKKLKEDMVRLSNSPGDSLTITGINGHVKSGASSTVEFVTSPDDDTINKLTAQLELVEKQRRQVIVENEKLTWQKESLEHIVDATSKERDEVRDKLKNVELLLSSKENNHTEEIKQLHGTIDELRKKMRSLAMNVHSDEIQKRDTVIQQLEAKVSLLQTELQTAQMHVLESQNIKNVSNNVEDLQKRDAIIQQLQTKVTSLQSDLKKAQMKILDLENVKFTQYKCGVSESVKTYKEHIQELNTRIKEIQTIVFQPVHMTMNTEAEASPHFNGYLSNVKLYDRTLKHLSEYLNKLNNGVLDSLVQIMSALSTLPEVTLERASIDRIKYILTEVKQKILKQHGDVSSDVNQVKSTLTIFEDIFKDYNELLKKTLTKREDTPLSIEQLTAALVARGEEVQSLENEIVMLVSNKEDCQLLKAQVELYKSDFEAERKSREQMVSEKETIATDLRVLQKKNQELTRQLDEVRKTSPSVYKTAISRSQSSSVSTVPVTLPTNSIGNNSAGNMVYTCPKCMFSSNQYKVMEDHFDLCLDDF